MITLIGDALLDRDLDGTVERVAPDAPVPVVRDIEVRTRPGGAGLAATLARATGAEVCLVTALGDDAAGARLRTMLEQEGIRVHDLGSAGPTIEKTRVRAAGHTLVRIDGGDGTQVGAMTRDAREAIADAAAVLVADYGAGVARAVRPQLGRTKGKPIVWDPHPRGDAPTPNTTIATPNFSEACQFAGREVQRADLRVATGLAEVLRARWRVGAVAVTIGARGAVCADGSTLPLVVPSARTETGDPCGAGDAFAAQLAIALAGGALPSEAVPAAVAAAGAYVAGRSSTSAPVEEAPTGSVVATSGCFDLLHAGHVHMLHQARRLGDRLVVLLNSDASVRRLKGPRRPIVPQEDRAQLLHALADVDEVVIFDEDTPERVLRAVRPDVFVKGGDYGARDIPESEVLAEWGGRAVVVPYLSGHSTSALVEEMTDAHAQ